MEIHVGEIGNVQLVPFAREENTVPNGIPSKQIKQAQKEGNASQVSTRMSVEGVKDAERLVTLVMDLLGVKRPT